MENPAVVETLQKVVGAAVEAKKVRTDITRFFLDNAKLRHGVPDDKTQPGDGQVEVLHRHEHKGIPEPRPEVRPTPPVVEQPAPTPVAEQPIKRSRFPGWVKWLLGGAVGAAALGGASGLTYWATSGGGDTPAVESPAEDSRSSLLQYLEDEGEHLP